MKEALFGLLGLLFGYLISFSIERIKVKNERGTYISKLRFDKEFEIYQELSEKNLTSVYDAGETARILSNKYKYTEEEKNQHLEKFCKDLNDAEFSNKRYAPFIDNDIFQKYKHLENMIKEIYTLYRIWLDNRIQDFLFKGEMHEKQEIKNMIIEKQKEVSVLSDEILNILRNYLKKLDAIK